MIDLPHVQPAFASQPARVEWPTNEWPRANRPASAALTKVVDEVFEMPELALTNAVIVIKGGEVLVERYAGVKEYFDRDPEPIDATSQLLSWSMAKSMLHMIIGTLVDQGRLDPDTRAPVREWPILATRVTIFCCEICSRCATVSRSSRTTRLARPVT